METITLGKTGEQVSRLGFGGATAGLKNYLGSYDPDNERDMAGVMDAIVAALEGGINYFDTAPGYGSGASERIFGKALEGVEDIFLATKHGIWGDTPVADGLKASLENLRRDQVDLLQIHGTHYSMQHVEKILKPGGLADQMEALREEGLVRYIGFTSEDNNDAVYALIHSGRFDVMQIAYNFVFQHPHDYRRECGSVLEARDAGMGIVSMRATTSGLFQRWLQQVRPDDDFNWTPHLIQFVLSNPKIDVVLVGMRNRSEVEQNIALVNDVEGRLDLDKMFTYFTDQQEKT